MWALWASRHGEIQYAAELQLQCLKDASILTTMKASHKLSRVIFGDPARFESLSEDEVEEAKWKYLEEVAVLKVVVQDRDGEPVPYAYEARRCMFRPLPPDMFDPDAPEPSQGGWDDKPDQPGQYVAEALARKRRINLDEPVDAGAAAKSAKSRRAE